MTTIAANLECMAADTRRIGDVISSIRKIRRYGNRIFGCAGDMECVTVFWRWADDGFNERKRPAMPEGCFDALELNDEGLWAWDKALCRYHLEDQYDSIGSGAMSAKTAMFLGKSPEEAVKVAAEHDESTGGRVIVEALLPPELLRVKKR
jgi:hypothetical protein